MKLLTTLFLIVTSLSTFAQHESGGAGNGGDGIVCGEEVTLLDSYEASKKRLKIDLGKNNKTIRAKVLEAVVRLEKFDPTLAATLKKYSLEMVDDIELHESNPEARTRVMYLGKDVIAPINDSKHVSIPEGCELRQLVSQRVPQFLLDYRYEVDESLWNKMSVANKSMTVLHEAWYRIMLENGAKNSISARYMNGLVAAREFALYNFQNYLKEIAKSELSNFVIPNTSTAIFDKTIVINLKEVKLDYFEDKVCAPNFKVVANFKRHTKRMNIRFLNFCFMNGKIHSLNISERLARRGFNIVMKDFFVAVGGTPGPVPTIIFHENGKFKGLKDIKIESISKLWYDCSEMENEEKSCTGPYLDRSAKINDPGFVYFSEIDEAPMNLRF